MEATHAHPTAHLLQRAGIGALWGLVCYALGDLIPLTAETYHWKMPVTTAVVLVPLGFFMLGVPLQKRVLRFLVLQVIILMGMSFYGTVVTQFRTGVSPYAILSQFIFWALTLLLFAAAPEQKTTSTAYYAAALNSLFRLSSAGILAVLTLGIFWLMLFLGAGLFSVVGISFFTTLFSKGYFSFPVSCAVFVLSLSIIHARFADTTTVLKRVVITPCAWLLPVACVIVCMFLVVLPFTGLSALWDTGHATALMLSLQLAVIAFTASSYQDGSHVPAFPMPVRRLISLGLTVLPVYAALCVYALSLRVAQHGWSVDRLWAVYFTLLISYASIGYALAALKKGPWLALLPRVNLGAVALMLALVLLASTPILNPERITTANQMKRLLSGAVKSNAFDYNYLKFSLGTYGNRALLELADIQEHPEKEAIQTGAKAALKKEGLYTETPVEDAQALRTQLSLFPKDAIMDESFMNAFLAHSQEPRMRHGYACLNDGGRCTFLKADINADGADEYILLDYNTAIFKRMDDEWKLVGNLQSASMSSQVWAKKLEESGFSLEKPMWQDLHVGKLRLSVWENRE